MKCFIAFDAHRHGRQNVIQHWTVTYSLQNDNTHNTYTLYWSWSTATKLSTYYTRLIHRKSITFCITDNDYTGGNKYCRYNLTKTKVSVCFVSWHMSVRIGLFYLWTIPLMKLEMSNFLCGISLQKIYDFDGTNFGVAKKQNASISMLLFLSKIT